MNDATLSHRTAAPNLWRINLVGLSTIVRKESRRVVRIWEKVRPWSLPAAGLIAVVAAGFGGYAWTQTQYYVANHNGDISIYRGIPQALGPFELSSLVKDTGVKLSDLQPFEQDRIRSAIQTGSLREAQDVVDGLVSTH